MNKSVMSTSVKTIKGKQYLYYTYYDQGKKRDMYCGLASNVQSEKKALQFELERLKKQKKSLSQKVIELEAKMKLL